MSVSSQAVVGFVEIRCPGCGEPLTTKVTVSGVDIRHGNLYVQLNPVELSHECKGKDMVTT